MRLDKYLKVSRLIKRRTVANDACDGERVTVNGRQAKASYDVKLGDLITVSFGMKQITVRVLEIKDTTKKSESSGMYEIVSESES
jgi:ribosomal 50S subunit-recycling heat shock protein